jgi:transaldolase
MKIFIDTAEIEEIKEAVSWGIVDGVTTNPSLIKKAFDKRSGKASLEGYIKEIIKIVPGPVSLEVLGGTTKEMIKQGKLIFEKFSSYGEVAVKIPINPSMNENDGMDFDGLKAIKNLSKNEIPVNVTLIMTAEQALLAAKAGAKYVSPFAGRIDDYIQEKIGMKHGVDFQKSDYFNHSLISYIRKNTIDENINKNHESISKIYKRKEIRDLDEFGRDKGVCSGVDLITRIIHIYNNYNIRTEVIAASIRNKRQAREVAEAGAHIATLPFNVIKEMSRHYKTIEGMRKFTADIVPKYERIFEK